MIALGGKRSVSQSKISFLHLKKKQAKRYSIIVTFSKQNKNRKTSKIHVVSCVFFLKTAFRKIV